MGKRKLKDYKTFPVNNNLFFFYYYYSLVGRNEAVVAVQGWRGGLGNTNTLRILITP